MSPLKGNGNVLFKITLFKKKKNTALPRWPAINQLSVQAPNLHTRLKAKPVEPSSPSHLPWDFRCPLPGADGALLSQTWVPAQAQLQEMQRENSKAGAALLLHSLGRELEMLNWETGRAGCPACTFPLCSTAAGILGLKK